MTRLSAVARTSAAFLLVLVLLGSGRWVPSAGARAPVGPGGPYKPEWTSLRTYPIPQWLRDGKFGIYTHWGVYAVPAMGPNATWYANNVYVNPASPQRKYHEATYGPLEKFGYKDFIPMFTGEKFNADEWADLFQKAGARFAGPVAEHHDGFSMWDTKYSEWNAAKMGPKRDVVGELSRAIKARGLKFVTAFHHAENWFYFPTWDQRYDCGDPRYSGLYGPIHEKGAQPTKAFLDRWEGKVIEVIDKYEPDFLWFDFGLELVHESYKKDLLAYYYNKAAAEHKEVVVAYKWHDLPPGVGLTDLELGQEQDMTYHEWITDSTVDAGNGWGYVRGARFRSLDNLIGNLVDRVSKNGYLLLNVGPKPDGTIPAEARELLLGMGRWLQVNGEAIYGTTPWFVAGEGPTKLEKNGAFNEDAGSRYTAEDIRFTVKGNVLYATALDWPGERILIKSLAPKEPWIGLYPSEIASITMLGDGRPLKWELTKAGLVVETPKAKPCEHAFVFKIVRKNPF
jgi:alpha-L-fucosidase